MAEKAFKASSIFVNLVAKTDKFERGMSRTRKQLGLVTRSVKNLAIGLGGLFAGHAVVRGIRTMTQEMDHLANTAQKLGVSIESLQQLRFAGGQNDVQSRTLDMAMQRFARRTGEAAKGMGEAKDAIKELGLDARKLVHMQLDQQMLLVADAFAKLDTQSEVLRLGFKLFDSEGVAVTNMLRDGAPALKAYMERAKETGAVLRDGLVREMAKLNNEIAELEARFGAMKTRAKAAALRTAIPAAEGLSSGYNEIFNPEHGGFWRLWQEGIGIRKPRLGKTGSLVPQDVANRREMQARGMRGAVPGPGMPLSEFDGNGFSLLRALRGVGGGMLGGLGSAMARRAGGPMAGFNRFVQRGGLSDAARSFGGLFTGGAFQASQPPGFRSLSALEAGSRGAFSQRVRSSQQRSVEKIQEKQLKEQSKTAKAVEGILEQVKNGVALTASNLQGAL